MKSAIGVSLEELSEEERSIVGAANVAPEERDGSGPNQEPKSKKRKSSNKPRAARLEVAETTRDDMERKREPRRLRVPRTFRVYPELLEVLSEAALDRKKSGYELWSQDAIVNDAIANWLRTRGYVKTSD